MASDMGANIRADNAIMLISKNIMDIRGITKTEDHYSIRRPVYIKDLCIFIFGNLI